MSRQIEIFEVIPKGKTKKQKILNAAFTPKIGYCEKRCGNYCTHFPDGTPDTYADGRTPRCVNMQFSDAKIILKNVWLTTCTNYTPKEGSKT